MIHFDDIPVISCWYCYGLIYCSGVLKAAGHKVEIKEMNDWNALEIWVNGEMVFTCDIRDLDFGKFTCKR